MQWAVTPRGWKCILDLDGISTPYVNAKLLDEWSQFLLHRVLMRFVFLCFCRGVEQMSILSQDGFGAKNDASETGSMSMQLEKLGGE